MSCIGLLSPQQRRLLRASTRDDGVLPTLASPEITAGARNEYAPTDVLRLLAHDSSAGVRGWVAANPSVPGDVLERLADDVDPTVRGVVRWARRWDSGGVVLDE